jgi:endonuclease YncB( thermonuclease family)
VVLLAAALALVDRLGWLGVAGTDAQRYHNQTFRVAKVIDGDTIHLAAPDRRGRVTKVRLIGIDCPEIARDDRPGMYFGSEAAESVRNRLLEREVRLELDPFQPSRDGYGRLLAFVYLPGEDESINEQLLAGGLAYAYRRFEHARKERCLALEARAHRQGVGLWAGVTPEQMPAWRRELIRP